MFNFNILSVLWELKPKSEKSKSFKPSLNRSYRPPAPVEIRKMIQRLSRCPKCHFLIFDNYWTNDLAKNSLKSCTTCGFKVES